MSPTQPASIRPQGGARASSPLIWLIEDEQLIGRLLEALLTSKGYQLRWFQSGEEALASLPGAQSPSCLVTDITLPGMSGLQAAQQLTYTWPDLPVLVISAYIFGGRLPHEPLPEGFEYLPKPFSPRALLARLDEMVPAAGG